MAARATPTTSRRTPPRSALLPHTHYLSNSRAHGSLCLTCKAMSDTVVSFTCCAVPASLALCPGICTCKTSSLCTILLQVDLRVWSLQLYWPYFIQLAAIAAFWDGEEACGAEIGCPPWYLTCSLTGKFLSSGDLVHSACRQHIQHMAFLWQRMHRTLVIHGES